MSSFILLPIFITYGLKSGAFITYYIYMIFIYLLFPIVPLVLASLLMTVIMRYTNIAKNKDRGNIFIGIVSILFIVGINVFLQWKNKSSFSEDAIGLPCKQPVFSSTNDKLFSNYIFWSSSISRKCKLKVLYM